MNLIKKNDNQDPERPVGTPIHEQVYQKLRTQILFGELTPGQAVTIQGLTEALGAGMTPVREAIRRLISDGALTFQGNRRVSVPVLTKEDVEQLIFLRKTIECELAYRATPHVSAPVIDDLVRIDQALDAAIDAGDVTGYLVGNYQFHSVLNGQANAPILADLSERLWLRFGPPLRVVCGRFGTQSLPDRHKDLLQALRNQDAEAASDAIAQDIEQGMEQIGAVLSNGT